MYRETMSKEQVAKFRKAIEKTADNADSSKIGYVGLIGSSLSDEPVHDLDILIFPQPTANVGETINAMNQFYKILDERLRKDNGLYLATCPRKVMQAEVNHIIGERNGYDGKLSTHTLFFPDYRSFKNLNPVGFLESIAQKAHTLKGDPAVIKRCSTFEQKVLDPYFLIADYQIPLVSGKYPEVLVLKKTEEIIDYLKENYGISCDFSASTPKECEDLTSQLLLELDKAA